jgi:predicted nucleotidyltransferase
VTLQPDLKSRKEGEYLETGENLIFSVKGLLHPPTHVIAFPKYVPIPGKINRRKGYKKIESLSESYRFLKENYPEYLRFDPVFNQILAEVPLAKIRRVFSPQDFLQNLLKKEKLDRVEKDSVSFVNLIAEYSSIPILNMGISGSLMVGLHTETSDIDLVVYGFKQSLMVYEALRRLVKEKNTPVKSYTRKDLERLYRFRVKDTQMSFRKFVQTETRKVLQGVFYGREYFVRLVKEHWETGEKYGEKRYLPVGPIELKAEVADDKESIFTPLKYLIKNVLILKGKKVDVKEIVSFRGRFCEQAKTSEKIFVRGTLEKVSSAEDEYYRVIVGGRKEDVIIPL